MTEVILKEIFNTTYGTTLVIEAGKVLSVGDIIYSGNERFIVEGFISVSRAKPDDDVSVIAKVLN